ncbi:MAG TPA: tRNA dihydrouridine synthase DusB [Chlamydiales bacterium]|nr:tRNA dihydrouridine synthase DusB [Chlamydiales bacterium]
MGSYQEPFLLGDLLLANNIFYAPLAGCSDLPFRRMSRKSSRPGLIYCEMVKMDALVRSEPSTFRLLDYEKEMHPIGAQLCGSKPELAAPCARIVEDLGFDVVDLNCGCPVDKVTKDGSGSGMLKTPELIGEILTRIKEEGDIPVTVKIRPGWDEKSINAPLITRIAEEAGAAAICIHGRTREQGYAGPANWDWIKECKQVAKNILVIGNGDVFDAPSAKRMFEYTGCDAVLVSRGTMGQPWIQEDIEKLFKEDKANPTSLEEVRDALITHFAYILEYQNERRALLDFRRVGCFYLKGCKGVKELRVQLNQAKSTEEALGLVHAFSWEASNEPAVTSDC